MLPDGDHGKLSAVLYCGLGIAFLHLGIRTATSQLLLEATSVLNTALNGISMTESPLLWAEIQHGLAMVMHRIGERETGSDSLDRAAVACRASLELVERGH